MTRSTGARSLCILLAAVCLPCAEVPAAPAAPAAGPGVKEVIVVFKTHFDIGYTDLARNVVRRYRTEMIDKALVVAEESKDLPPDNRFVWTLSGWPMKEILGPQQTGDRRKRIVEAIRDGRLVWHALPATLHVESLDLEDLVRGMRFSSDLSRSLDMPLPRDAKMTDVAAHTWLVPTVLVRAGVEFLHLGCNAASTSPEVPVLFWWEGPDGSRLLTMYSAGDYGTGLTAPAGWPYATWLALIHTGDNHGPPTAGEVRALLDRAAKQLPGVKIRMGRLSDFSDAIRREKIDIPVVRGDMPDSWVHGIMSMPQETALARSARPTIVAAESLGTLLAAWGAGVPSPSPAPSAKDAIATAYEQSLLYGEHTWGIDFKRFGKRLYGSAWQAEHDAGKYKLAEESWAEHGNYARNAAKAATAALEAGLAALAAAVKADGPRVVVYNPLPWTRDDVVTAQWGKGVPPDVPEGLIDLATGKALAVQADSEGRMIQFIAQAVPALGYKTYVRLGGDSGRGVGVSPARPAGILPAAPTAGKMEDSAKNSQAAAGTATGRAGETPTPQPESTGNLVKPQPETPTSHAAAGTIENAFFRVRLDPARGGVASIVDKRTNRELVDSSEYALGQYVWERFDADQVAAYVKAYCKIGGDWVQRDYGKPDLPAAKESPGSTVSPKNATLEIAQTNLAVTATLRTKANDELPHEIALRVTLYRDQPWVDLEWSIKDKPATPWPEAGWLALPLKVDHPAFRLGRTGSIVDPAKDVIRAASHVTFCLNTGLTATGEGGAGVGLCPIDSPIVSIERRGIYQFSKDFLATKPLVWVNLYNNAFSVNFQQWIGGSWSSRVRLWSVPAGAGAAEALITPGWEARQPCRVAVWAEGASSPSPAGTGATTAPADSPAAAGTLPPSRAGIVLSRSGVLVTAFGPNIDGPGTILRLWEQSGSDQPCRVKLPEGLRPAKAQPVDLRGRPVGAAIPVQAGELTVPMTPFAPASLLLGE